MNFIEKIFLKKTDNLVHLQFQKFSRGIFDNRALINAKRAGNKYSIFTGPRTLQMSWSEKWLKSLGSRKTNFSGAVISTNDLTGKLDFSSKKQFQGVKSYIINKELTGDEIIKLLNEFPKAFFALSFKVDDTELKIKAKAPKSGKPKGKDKEKPKADFCKIITTDEKIGKGFVFEKSDFKKADITHSFVIEDIVIPESLKSSKDFSLVREESKKKR